MKKCNKCKQDKSYDQYYKHALMKDGYQLVCKPCHEQAMVEYRNRNREKYRSFKHAYLEENKEKIYAKRKIRRGELRRNIISHYGAKCRECGITEERFLTIDHVNNDGALDRKKDLSWYSWIIKNNYPDTLQILCWNCNCTKSMRYSLFS